MVKEARDPIGSFKTWKVGKIGVGLGKYLHWIGRGGELLLAHSKLGRSVGVGLGRIQNCVGSAYDISGVTNAHKGGQRAHLL